MRYCEGVRALANGSPAMRWLRRVPKRCIRVAVRYGEGGVSRERRSFRIDVAGMSRKPDTSVAQPDMRFIAGPVRTDARALGRDRPPGMIVQQPNGAEPPAVRLRRAIDDASAACRLIARRRRRKSTPGPGAASSRGPSDVRGDGRPTVRTPIHSGRAASSSSRRSTYSRATSVAAGGGRVAAGAAQSPGDSDKAACRARGSDPAAGVPAAARAEPRRYATSRRLRRGQRSVRWRATVSVDSWRVLSCNRVCLTLTCQLRGRVTAGVKAVTACHDVDGRLCCLFAASSPLQAACAGKWRLQRRRYPSFTVVYQLGVAFLVGQTRDLRRNWVKIADFAVAPRSACCFYATVKLMT